MGPGDRQPFVPLLLQHRAHGSVYIRNRKKLIIHSIFALTSISLWLYEFRPWPPRAWACGEHQAFHLSVASPLCRKCNFHHLSFNSNPPLLPISHRTSSQLLSWYLEDSIELAISFQAGFHASLMVLSALAKLSCFNPTCSFSCLDHSLFSAFSDLTYLVGPAIL